MHVFVTGGSGFVGSHLIPFLLSRGHRVVGTGTSKTSSLGQRDGYTYISADTTAPGDWQEALQNVDAVINLAGRNIFQTWNQTVKQSIYDSRILTTRNLVQGLNPEQKTAFLSTSAVGYYGDRGEESASEEAPPGNDFLAGVCRDWEAEAHKAEAKGARVAVMRFGVVLHAGGGALAKMLPAYKFGLGGPLGSGRQWFPWIHLHDLMAAAVFLLESPELSGPFNFCAPQTVRQRDFAKTLGKVLGRPAFLKAPTPVLRLFLGELGRALLSSQKAQPDKLLKSGFTFQFPELESALTNCLTL